MKIKDFLRRVVAIQLERRVRLVIEQKKLKVVAVTGSVGKTTTKLATASVLSQKYKVLAHPGNLNTEIGLPLALFDLDVPENLTNPLRWLKIFRQIDRQIIPEYPYEVVVLEMGADRPGEIKKFMRYIRPDIGIVTAIAPVHTEGFGSVDAIAEEKMSLARGSQSVLLNAEDRRVMTESKKLLHPFQTYGVEKGGVHFDDIKRSPEMTLEGELQLHNGEIKVKTNFVGRHSLSALAVAAAVGEEMGLELRQIKKGLEEFGPVSGRMQVLAGAKGAIILDDSYNSSPRSAVTALETLGELPGRKIAILGSMNELGKYAERGHREVGKAAAKVDVLITIGDQANRWLVAGAAEGGFAADKIHQFDSPYEAGKYASGIIKKGDVVLAKGSQNGVFAEEAVAYLLAKSEDRAKLVRQSPSWLRRKHEQFAV